VKGKADYTLDVRGIIAPFSLLKASLLFQQLKQSQALDILGCDADMQRDLLRLLPDASFESIVKGPPAADMDGEIAIVRLRKQPRLTQWI
jgi:TusA-related sulfurtransferase